MSLFKRDFNKPGPGVPKNAPRKKGIARFFEILIRDSGNLVKLNLLMQLCFLLPQAALIFAILALSLGDGPVFIICLVAGLVFSIPVGPARAAESHILSKMLRDDPGFVWHDFKKLFKENFKGTVLPGIFYSLVLGSQILAIAFMLISGQTISPVFWGFYVLSVLIFAMAAPYFFLQASYLQLKTGGLLKNSLFLALGYLPRSIAGALIVIVFVLGQIILDFFMFPLSSVFILFTILVGYVAPTLINLMWIWPHVDKTFEIDKTLKARENEMVGERLEESEEKARAFAAERAAARIEKEKQEKGEPDTENPEDKEEP